jgi:hypothetical protein
MRSACSPSTRLTQDQEESRNRQVTTNINRHEVRNTMDISIEKSSNNLLSGKYVCPLLPRLFRIAGAEDVVYDASGKEWSFSSPSRGNINSTPSS